MDVSSLFSYKSTPYLQMESQPGNMSRKPVIFRKINLILVWLTTCRLCIWPRTLLNTSLVPAPTSNKHNSDTGTKKNIIYLNLSKLRKETGEKGGKKKKGIIGNIIARGILWNLREKQLFKKFHFIRLKMKIWKT